MVIIPLDILEAVCHDRVRLPGAEPLGRRRHVLGGTAAGRRDSDLVESIKSRSDAYLSGNVLLSYVKWTSSVLWAVLGELGFE